MAALPIADRPEVIAEAKLLISAHRWAFIKMLFFYAGAAVSALFGPWILGNLTNEAAHHQLTGHKVTVMVCQLAVASVIYTALTFFARRRSYVLGEQIFAELRENFFQVGNRAVPEAGRGGDDEQFFRRGLKGSHRERGNEQEGEWFHIF